VIYDASWDRWNRLGLVQILSEKNIGIPVSVVKRCRTDLRELAKDEAFADTWRDPKLFSKAIENMLKNVEAVLEHDAERMAKWKKKALARYGRRRTPRLIHDAFFRPRDGERHWEGQPKLLPIPEPKRRRRRRRRAKKA
jgi:hypothetical protein